MSSLTVVVGRVVAGSILVGKEAMMTTVTFQVDDDLLQLADVKAAESGQPRDAVLAAALRRGLGGGQFARLLTQARRGPQILEDDAMALAQSELKAMRAERRNA
jgi:hypothetical protein